MSALFLLKRFLLIGLMIGDALIAYFCSGFHDDEPSELEQLAAENLKLAVQHIAERQSQTANSLKNGQGQPVPGGVPGTGTAVVAAPAAGPNAKAQLVTQNNGATQIVSVNSNGTAGATVSAPNGFANVSASPDGSAIAGTAGTTFAAFNTSPLGSAFSVNLGMAPAPAPNAGNTPRALTPHITPAPVPAGTAIMPDKSGAYITDQSSAVYYWVSYSDQSIKTYNNTVSPAGSGQPAILPNGSQLWIPNRAANSITVYDTFTNTLVTTITGLTAPSTIAFTADGTRAAVILSSPNTGSIAAVDTTQYKVLGSVQVGFNPNGLSLQPYTTKFWTANTGSGTISEVDVSGTTPVVVETDPVGTSPVGVAALTTYVP